MFKNIILILILVSSAFSSEIKWEKNFKSAIERAKKVNKPIFFVSSRHSCRYCVVLEQTTFQDAQVIKDLNDNFVSVIAYSDENDYMPRELWRPGTPAMWFLKPDGTPMFEPLMGAYGAKNVLQAFAQVKEEFKAISIKEKNDFYKLKK